VHKRPIQDIIPPWECKGAKATYVFLPRTIEGSAKSSKLYIESRELADVPLYRDPITTSADEDNTIDERVHPFRSPPGVT